MIASTHAAETNRGVPRDARRWIDAGSVEQIPKRGARVVVCRNLRIAVFRTRSGDLYAVEDRCPHRDGPVSEGLVHGDQVTCPLHGWVFDLRTGEAQGVDEGCLASFDIVEREGRVQVLVPEDAL